MKIYLAGSIFSTIDQLARKTEAKFLREKGYEVFNPIEINTPNATKQSIFEQDYQAIQNCDAMIAIIDGFDCGTMNEIGVAKALNKPVIGVYTDGKYGKLKQFIPEDNLLSEGLFNLFTFGCCEQIVASLPESLKYLKKEG